MNILIGDIGNTKTKICLIDYKTSKIIKVLYFDSIKIKSLFFIKNILKKFFYKKKNSANCTFFKRCS